MVRAQLSLKKAKGKLTAASECCGECSNCCQHAGCRLISQAQQILSLGDSASHNGTQLALSCIQHSVGNLKLCSLIVLATELQIDVTKMLNMLHRCC